jgi:hypothetical protein
VGGAAHGRGGRYRYYRCFTRQRYGVGHCDADFLPADALEHAVIESLNATYAQRDLIDRAIAEYRSGATSARPRLTEHLALTEAEIRKAEEAIDRYLHAFENGTLSEAHCGARVASLAERLAELRSRSAELSHQLGDENTDDAEPDVDGITLDLGRLLTTDAPASTKKALLQTLIEDVLVASRDHIEPTYRVPLAPVRNLSAVVVLRHDIDPDALHDAQAAEALSAIRGLLRWASPHHESAWADAHALLVLELAAWWREWKHDPYRSVDAPATVITGLRRLVPELWREQLDHVLDAIRRDEEDRRLPRMVQTLAAEQLADGGRISDLSSHIDWAAAEQATRATYVRQREDAMYSALAASLVPASAFLACGLRGTVERRASRAVCRVRHGALPRERTHVLRVLSRQPSRLGRGAFDPAAARFASSPHGATAQPSRGSHVSARWKRLRNGWCRGGAVGEGARTIGRRMKQSALVGARERKRALRSAAANVAAAVVKG